MKKVSLLGSTGSIGENALDVIRASDGFLEAAVLCAGTNAVRLGEQVREFRPRLAVVADSEQEAALRKETAGVPVEIASGEEGVLRAAAWDEADVVLSAIVGAAGILPAWHALEAGKDLALANKETLVAAGEVIMETARRKNCRILPVDSEHHALFQTLEGRRMEEVRELVLTASGGPFWSDPGRDFTKVTPADALRHPRWEMGDKISIDSATLMNKGLELIEARWLFGFDMEKIAVMVHPQSIVHSLVEFVDGSMMAHLSRPDMRLPIAAALYYPERKALPWPRLDLAEAGRLDFSPPDSVRFPALDLARRAEKSGGGMPAVLNAANEIAVEAFLKGRIAFPDIVALSERVMDNPPVLEAGSDINTILEIDGKSRAKAEEIAEEMSSARRN